MRQFKKLLSVILAVIMVFSSVSVLASAYGTAWKDSGIKTSQYNTIDVPTLTTEQYATAALDEVDRMLDVEQIKLTQDDIFVGDLDVTSINAALDSVNTILNGSLWNQFKNMLGDLQNLNISALTVRRTNGGSDVAVINSLLKFLYDNKGLLSGFVKGEIDLGSIVAQFVDLSDFEVPGLLKGMLYEAAYNTDAPDKVTQTVDTMAQDLIDALVVTGYNGDEPLLPELAGHTNISNGSMLTFIDDALKILYNDLLVPRANRLWIDDINELLADYSDEISKYQTYFNLTNDGKVNFQFQPYNFDNSKLVLEQLNDVLASIINLALSPSLDFKWEKGDNSMIVKNIITIGREVLSATGRDFFASYVEIYDKAKLDTMTDMQVVAYVARTILNSSIEGVWIPNTADNLVKVGSYLVKDLMATQLPERDYSSETAYPVDDINTVYTILSDFGIKALNENPGLNLEYGIGIDALAKAGANWVINKYGGLLSGINLSTSDSGWANLDKLIFRIIDKSWFDASAFGGNVTTEKLVKDVLINNIVNLKFENLIDLLCNKSSSSEFVASSPKQLILNIVTRVLNTVFPGLLKTGMTSLEEIITAQNLGNTVDALFSDLYNSRATLVPAVLPLVCDILDLTTEETFKKPTFSVDKFYYRSGAINESFTITNGSYGINTGYTDPATGVFHQDSLFKIKLEDVAMDVYRTGTTTKMTGFTVKMPENRVINGGEKVKVNFSGSVNAVLDVVFTIKYNVIKEDGQNLTNAPLTARIYTCFSGTNSDDAIEWTSTSGAVQGAGGLKNIFITSPKGLDDLEFKVRNKTGADNTLTATFTNASNDARNVSFVIANPEKRTILKDGTAILKPLALDGYEGTEAQDLEAFTSNGYKQYQLKTAPTIGSAKATAITSYINLYKDYGLIDLFTKEVNAQRQASDYDATAYNAYLTAMQQAASVVLTKKTAATYCTATGVAKNFKGYAEALETAVENLEATAVGGVTALRDRLTEIDPSNKGKDFMTDSDYSFFSSDNYLMYTWSNFRDKYKAADRFASEYEEGGKYYELGEKPEALDVIYKTWELNNYYARLRPVDDSKVNLARAINEANARNYDSSLYTEESFDRYENAIAFANSVNSDASAVQHKINLSYIELIEAQKRLIATEAEEEDELVLVAAEVSPVNPDYAPQIIVNSAGEKLLLGVAPEDSGIELSEYFAAESGDMSKVEFVCEKFGTGKAIQVVDKVTGDVIDEFIMVIKGDIDGSGTVSGADLTKLGRVVSGSAELSESGDSAFDYAADIDFNGSVSGADRTTLSRAISGSVDLDFAKY